MTVFSRQTTYWGAVVISLLSLTVTLGAQSGRQATIRLNDPESPFRVTLGFEQGFVGVVAHTIQFDQDGTQFDYVADGGQSILFPTRRFSAEISIASAHRLVLVYQPIDIRTVETVKEDLIVNDGTFTAGTPVSFRYGFDFYRLSWLYDFATGTERELAAGISLQVRDAVIGFESLDGTLLRIVRDVGPVPIIKLRARLPLRQRIWVGGEIDGFYADGRYISGSTNDFVGAILDASLRLGVDVSAGSSAYLNLRYLGGGARGTDESYGGPGDGYTDNWLHTVGLAVGLTLR